MYKIATMNKISPVGLDELGENYAISEDISDAEGIIVRSADMHEIDLPESLLAIARAGAGVNNIPLDKCAEKGIVVFNAPGANANAVKELVLAGMLLSSRNITAAQQWANGLLEDPSIDISKAVEKGKGQFAGTEIAGKTIGVIGLGAIGVQVANMAKSLGMKVLGYDPYLSLSSAHILSKDIPVTDDLSSIFPECDFITVHVPVLDDTRGMINKDAISKMKDGVVILNFARGPLVNDEDVLEALESGKIKHFVTDFPDAKTLGKKGVIVTPHLGASTEEAEDNCASMAANEIKDYLENGNITNSVNFPGCTLGAKKEGICRVAVLNRNVPKVISSISSIFAEQDINLSNFNNQSRGDYAYTLIDIDATEDVLTDSIEELKKMESVLRVRVIK